VSQDAARLLRALPSVSDFLGSEAGRALAGEFGEGALKFELRRALDEAREAIRAGRAGAAPDPAALAADLRTRLLRLSRPAGRRAVNATGILLHTGLGRAPLCAEAAEALAGCARYSVLQADLRSGERSLREEKVERLLRELVGCEAATVVNNNAAATMLILNTLVPGREVIVSRGQLIEIGGAFRLPEVMAKSGAVLREVGTTNRTHLRDYESAIGEATGAILHVHTSNYRVRGFASAPEIGELCELGRRRNLPVLDDLGSGALVPLREFGLPDEPLVAESLKAGSLAACFSGDKLISGPQSGIICGKGEAIERIRKNPFMRMFRVGKLTLAALEATLLHFLNGESWRRAIPLYRTLARPAAELQEQAQRFVKLAADVPGLALAVAEDISYIGSGSAPDEGVPTRAVAVDPGKLSADGLARELRLGVPAVFARIKDGRVLLDMRTVAAEEVEELAGCLRAAAARESARR
jgi:L-seryl-tRNA(Ser) seleniumtransferase